MFDAFGRIVSAVVVLTVTLVLVDEIRKRDLVEKAIAKTKAAIK